MKMILLILAILGAYGLASDEMSTTPTFQLGPRARAVHDLPQQPASVVVHQAAEAGAAGSKWTRRDWCAVQLPAGASQDARAACDEL